MPKRAHGSVAEAGTAFRRYARLGLDRREMTAFDVYDNISGICPSFEAALDMLAVFDTMRLLDALGRRDCAAAVRAVYFYGAGRRLRRNDVTLRVRRHAWESHCDERTVYRRLDLAKKLYMTVRKNQD